MCSLTRLLPALERRLLQIGLDQISAVLDQEPRARRRTPRRTKVHPAGFVERRRDAKALSSSSIAAAARRAVVVSSAGSGAVWFSGHKPPR